MFKTSFGAHQISAIINISQNVREEWPLVIYDHLANEHKIYMKPGEVILYESAKCYHGRPIPLEGSEYSNIFVHYRPTKWNKINNDMRSLLNKNMLINKNPIDYI